MLHQLRKIEIASTSEAGGKPEESLECYREALGPDLSKPTFETRSVNLNSGLDVERAEI
jgi:hypothetical protein